MTITANELLNLFTKVNKLGYTYDVSEDEKGGYKIAIRHWDRRKTTLNLYINNTSDRFYNGSYDEFDEVMEDLDRQLNAKVIDKEKEERFKQYQQLQKEFGNKR